MPEDPEGTDDDENLETVPDVIIVERRAADPPDVTFPRDTRGEVHFRSRETKRDDGSNGQGEKEERG